MMQTAERSKRERIFEANLAESIICSFLFLAFTLLKEIWIFARIWDSKLHFSVGIFPVAGVFFLPLHFAYGLPDSGLTVTYERS